MAEQDSVFSVGLVNPRSPAGYADYLPANVESRFTTPTSGLVIGIEKDGVAYGAISGDFRHDPEGDLYFMIISIYVAPSGRRMGGGTLLYETLKWQLMQYPEKPMMIMADTFARDKGTKNVVAFLREMGMFEAEPPEDEDRNLNGDQRHILVEML